MDRISDLLPRKSEDLNVQVKMAQPLAPDDAEWMKHKKFVDSLPTDYKKVLQDVCKLDPKRIREWNNEKMLVVTIPLKKASQVFETVLEIQERKEDGFKKVAYLAYQKDPANVYVRYLVNTF